MSNYAKISNDLPMAPRRPTFTWNAGMHEDVLCGILTYYNPSQKDCKAIHTIMQERGHPYTASALR